jgi:hypothetical protein
VWAEGLGVPQYTESWLWDFNNRLIGTAKWEDILKLHEIDKHNVLYHLTHNVMHRHLNTIQQRMMKVSFIVQVMSNQHFCNRR